MRSTSTVSAAAVLLVGALALAGCAGAGPSAPVSSAASGRGPTSVTSAASPDTTSSPATDRAFRALERDHGARLGVTAIDTGTGRQVAWRAGERFAFASANKVFIAAALLARSSDADLDTVVHYDRADLLAYAPVTSQSVATGMTVRALLDAMLRFSDNTAANLLVERVGGPGEVQRFLRDLGDRTTNVDRVEPDLNEATPGDARDTTTPAQFAADVRAVLLGSALEPSDRRMVRETMLRNTTGDATIRAGVDPAWSVADKTGTGSYGVRNDIGVVYPTGRAPIVVVVMTSKGAAGAEPDDALVATATRVAVTALGR
ncbi:class A beta-lactamase [Curtobacterium sp. VKM Ac-2865]|uniref:class A beta-lactamase n=1 Tax=Curtobacterium sp. VKM Ac-2865 TaxID=2783817 RepID=UPI00188B946D|nr:class A beta-lactamase [Curtobacterium sp. VKM Ac-2865]MBF4583429.1 class A beta-lactamase [Curtobacterium sp. VKM Ac-2865]